MARVAGDHELWLACDLLLRPPLVQVGHEALGGAADIVEIHRVRPHAGKLRRLIIWRVATLRFGNDLADGPTAQTAGAKSERAKEAVVQFIPLSLCDQLRDYLLIKRRGGAVKKRRDILRGRVKELAGPESVCDFRLEGLVRGRPGQ